MSDVRTESRTVTEFICTWTIANFQELHPGEGSFISSKVSVAGEDAWLAVLYPDGHFKNSEFVGIIVLSDRKWQSEYSPFLFTISIVDCEEQEHERYRTHNVTAGIADLDFIQKDYLAVENSRWLQNGNLVLRFKVYYNDKDVIKSKSTCIIPHAMALKLNSLECIFNNEKFSDVKIVVGDKQFYAYKGILVAQSPVFAAMFEHDMSENKESIVQITDVDHEVIQEMLRFIYVGKVNNIEVIARKLLVAADKYKFEQLKIICEESLINDLNVETVTGLLIYADKYGAETLKERALQFFKLNAKKIIQTKQYELDFNDLLPVLPKLIERLVL